MGSAQPISASTGRDSYLPRTRRQDPRTLGRDAMMELLQQIGALPHPAPAASPQHLKARNTRIERRLRNADLSDWWISSPAIRVGKVKQPLRNLSRM